MMKGEEGGRGSFKGVEAEGRRSDIFIYLFLFLCWFAFCEWKVFQGGRLGVEDDKDGNNDNSNDINRRRRHDDFSTTDNDTIRPTTDDNNKGDDLTKLLMVTCIIGRKITTVGK